MIDHTHNPLATSWVTSANQHPDFPIQNLPLGIFSTDETSPRIGTAIGSSILDLKALAEAGLLSGNFTHALGQPQLNELVSLGNEALVELRHRLFDILVASSNEREAVEPFLVDADRCAMHLPTRIGGYTDFYAGIVHATNVGRLLRPDNPLMPNYKFIPIGYHGRTSSIRPSGTDVRRPKGQLKGPADPEPRFAASERLDYEVELGIWIGKGNELGEPIALAEARDHIAGLTLLNDWSARDIQTWEYQPLGPFLAKNFGTTVSPWLVTGAALAPFRTAVHARSEGDPHPLAYLDAGTANDSAALNIDIEVSIRSSAMASRNIDPLVVGRTRAVHLYWTPDQMVAHHSSNGCNLEPGDLLGTGTISAPGREGFGSLMEITSGGAHPFEMPSGEIRRFLEDGDEVVLTGSCSAPGFRSIGFGECRAAILPAKH